MPSALITGARGFLGGHIARHLLEEGWQVTALLRPDSDGTALSEAGVSVVHAPMWRAIPAYGARATSASTVTMCSARERW